MKRKEQKSSIRGIP